MATYKEIQGWVKSMYGYSVKTCWVAHVKELVGLRVRVAPNRLSSNNRQNPCPNDKVGSIRDAFKHFRMI